MNQRTFPLIPQIPISYFLKLLSTFLYLGDSVLNPSLELYSIITRRVLDDESFFLL